MSLEDKGASSNERLLAAARADNEEMLLEVFDADSDFDINCQDGLGNTPLHLAVANGSTDVLEHILSCDGCDVDPQNKLQGATPLHLAVQIEHTELRKFIVESLLEAGADFTIKDKNGDTALDYIPTDEVKLRALFRKQQAQAAVSADDVASDGDDGAPGSGSGSDDD